MAGSYILQKDKLRELVIYADDFNFLFPMLKNNDNSHVSKEHIEFINWVENTKLFLNLNKCKILTIVPSVIYKDIHNINFLPALPIVQELRLLGVVFNSRLNWQSHVSVIFRTAACRLYAIRKLRPLLSDSDL